MDLMAREAGCESKATETKPETEPEEGCEEEEEGEEKKEAETTEQPTEQPNSETTEEPQAEAQTEDRTTEKEAPAGEIPATTETLDVPAEVQSQPVEAGENVDVQAVVEEAVEKATQALAESVKALETKLAEAETEIKRLVEVSKAIESDMLKVSVAKGFASSSPKGNVSRVTDAMVLKSLGL